MWKKKKTYAPNSPVLMHSNPQHLPPIHRDKIPHPTYSYRPPPPQVSPLGEKIATVIIAMRSLPILLLPLLLVATAAVATIEATTKALVGGWQPIKNINDAHVQEIAKFAVSEHNKLANTKLVFNKVEKGETQVVAGINYRLVVEAKTGGAMAKYEAEVWEKAWERFRKLTSFKPVKS